MKRAIIDLGTNTFHLLIVNEANAVELKLSRAAKIGLGGIEQGIITEEGIVRALSVLEEYKAAINDFKIGPSQVYAFGTSAFRSASNREQVLKRISDETGIKVQVISGDKEAELIYLGVKQAVSITDISMIVDIGGGSVEFIICSPNELLWKQSFEIGGQRLIDRFFTEDPFPRPVVAKMNDYFRTQLLPLTNACHQYSPNTMIGSSGSFDTLNSIHFFKTTGQPAPAELKGNDYPTETFHEVFEQLLSLSRSERLAIPGMIELRVDMIVVAVILIQFLIQNLGIDRIQVSKYAMKEGILTFTA